MKRATVKSYGVDFNGYESTFLVVYQKNGKSYDLTIMFDDFGKEIGRTTERHQSEKEAFRAVLEKAWLNTLDEYIKAQKRIYKSLMEPYPSDEELRGMFRSTRDREELEQLRKQAEGAGKEICDG